MPAGDNSFPWDFTLTISGGATYGFMLTTPKDQTKQIKFTEAQMPNPNRITTSTEANVQDFDSRFDVPFTMDDFSGGVGQLNYDGGDPTKYLWSSGVITHVSGRAYLVGKTFTLTTPAANSSVITGFATYLAPSGTRWDFCWSGITLLRRNASNSTNAWEAVSALGGNITDFNVIDGVGFYCCPSVADPTDFYIQSDVTRSTASWFSGTGVTAVNHTPFSAAAGKPKFMRQIRGTTYAVVDSNKVYYSIAPTTDAWTGPITTSLSGNISGPPGGTSYPFVGVDAVGDFLMLRKKDAIYSIDAQQNVIEAVWQWKTRPSQYNFKYAATNGNYLFYSCGNEVYAYNPQSGDHGSFELAKQDSFSCKEILGISAAHQYVYVLASVNVPTIRSSTSRVMFRCFQRPNGKWVYEVLWEDTTLTAWDYACCFASPAEINTRLYAGIYYSTSTPPAVTYLDMPSLWDESSTTTLNWDFSTGNTSLWTSISRSGFPGFTKRHLYFNLNGQRIAANKQINTYYSTDIGTTFTSLVASGTSDNITANFTNTSSTSIMYRFDMVSTTTSSPILLNFDHHQRVRFKYLPQASVVVRVADNITARNGSTINLPVWQIWDNIVTLRTTNSEILYKDFLGNSFNVTVDMVGVEPSRHQQSNGAINAYEEEAHLIITRCDRGS